MYFCHSCFRFHNLQENNETLTNCTECQSPLIEIIQNEAHRHELEIIMRQRQGEQLGMFVQGNIPLIRTLLSDNIINRVIIELSSDEGIYAESRSCPPVEEIMNSFITFSNGLQNCEEYQHEEPLGGPCCSICREDMISCTESVVRLPCRHCFHSHCMRPWLRERPLCPICRTSLLPAQDGTVSDG